MALTELDPLTELLAVAEEQLRWQRAAALPQVRDTIEHALSSTQLRHAYELCDGEHTLRQIARTVGAGLGSLSRWTRNWRNLGIAFERADGRIQHLVSLEALGLPIETSEPQRRQRRRAS
jgi:hypothetical protein